MPNPPAHAKPARRDGLRWAVAVIAAFALYDIWGAWAEVGDKSGFAHGTGWTLTVIVEVFGVCALYGWLEPAGPRSRRFAMWSAMIVLVLSLIGQGSAHLTARSQVPPPAVVVFVSVLPVIVLALIAVLVHLRHLDRAGAAQAEEAAAEAARSAAAEAAEASELAAVRAELDAARTAVEPLRADLETARAELARVTAKAESLAAKLEAMSAQRKRKRTAQQRPAGSAQEDDLSTEMRALTEMEKDPALRGPRMGGELARRLGVSAATGRRLHTKLTAQDRPGESLSERSADTEDERSDERS
jgi:Skp family chaperone for outer membrane proteins